MLNKKSQEIARKWLIIPIVILLTLVILLFFINELKESSSDLTNQEACKRSVQAKEFSTGFSGAIEESFQGLFHSPDEADLKCTTETEEIDLSNKEEIMKNLADELYSCYDMFNRCETENIFGSDGEKYCFICSVISFDNKELVITESEMQDYLDTKIVFGENGLSYSDVFAGCSYYGCAKEYGINPGETSNPKDYDTSKKYSTVFHVNEELSSRGGSCGVVLIEHNSQEYSQFCSYIYTSLTEE